MGKLGRFTSGVLAQRGKAFVDKYVGETTFITPEEANSKVLSLIAEHKTFSLVFQKEGNYRLVIYTFKGA